MQRGFGNQFTIPSRRVKCPVKSLFSEHLLFIQISIFPEEINRGKNSVKIINKDILREIRTEISELVQLSLLLVSIFLKGVFFTFDVYVNRPQNVRLRQVIIADIIFEDIVDVPAFFSSKINLSGKSSHLNR